MKRLFNKVFQGKYLKKCSKGSGSEQKCPKEQSKSRAQNLIDIGVAVQLNDENDDDDDERRLDDYQYQNISLSKSYKTEKLGLALSYDNGDSEEETNIYVSQIERNNIVDKDGRIKVGDQILQINGMDVHTKNQAVELFSTENLEITLLIARRLSEEDLLVTVSSDLRDCREEEDVKKTSALCRRPLPPLNREEETLFSDGTLEKDSGISRTTDSEDCSPKIAASDEPTTSNSGDGRLFTLIKCPRFVCEGSQMKREPQKVKRSLRPVATPPDVNVEQELMNLHKEMQSIQLQCHRLIAEHVEVEQQVQQQLGIKTSNMPNGGYSTPISFLYPKTFNDKHPMGCEKTSTTRDETSSAYNTGNDSCRSTPMNTIDGTRRRNSKETVLLSADSLRKNSAKLMQNDLITQSTPNMAKAQLNDDGGWAELQRSMVNSCKGTLTSTDAASMDLQQKLMLQQRMLRQAMIQQAYKLKIEQERLSESKSDDDLSGAGDKGNEALKVEWKLKRRSDGTRYITHRLIRNKVLKERAQQLTAIRAGGSTDDDAFSELKTGKYWTREEKKRHLERAKERKRRQEDLLKRKKEVLRNGDDETILRMSQKKLLRRQGEELLDNFTTIREFLSHDTRTVDGKHSLGILSVTTV